MRTSGTLLVLFCLLGVFVPASAQSISSVPVDTVRTVPLSEEITSWGQLGGVTVDRLGFIYVANFRDGVWRVAPDGEAMRLTGSLYGSSGNAVDARGNLLQANFFANTIDRVDRQGRVERLIDQGLSGPVGIALRPSSGEFLVANCRSNSIARAKTDGSVSVFARSELFKCPNGVAIGPRDELYVVNFSDNKMLKVTSQGQVSLFAEVSEKRLGHLAFYNDRFYVTAFHSHEIYQVSLSGQVTLLAGTGQRGTRQGPARQALLSYPNGIAVHRFGRRIYFNEFLHADLQAVPPKSMVRQIVIPSRQP